jgi:hypothetical protein
MSGGLMLDGAAISLNITYKGGARVMHYWITTHWPFPADEDSSQIHEGVYVADGNRHVVKDMKEGDLVFIYETGTGRPFKGEDNTTVYYHAGREGIVELAEIESEIYPVEYSKPTKYANGTQIWWKYCADTKPLNTRGFIPREWLNKVLNYRPNNLLRGFGDYHSGVKQLSEEQFNALLAQFVNAANNELFALQKVSKVKHSAHAGGTGEGAIHKAIKAKIAKDPEGSLCEKGLVLVQTEYNFITGDRVDVLLMDRYGRPVVVEVEPDCPVGAHIGTAQSVKYRTLAAFEMNREYQEIRAILAAPYIASDVAEKAKKHLIEIKIVNPTNRMQIEP